LVTLSACQTHFGDEKMVRNLAVQPGDELVGLEQAFFRAGTPSLLSTLWSVEEQSTADLMGKFYTLLKQGVPKAEALRQAQVAMQTHEKYSHPYYWAGFVLVGDPGAAASIHSVAHAPTVDQPRNVLLYTSLVTILSIMFIVRWRRKAVLLGLSNNHQNREV
jgi:hypothetical protein